MLDAQAQLHATASFGSTHDLDVTDWATWSSSDARVLNVSPKGLVTVAGTGASVVSAKYQGHTDSVRVSVVPDRLAATAVTPPPGTRLRAGQLVTFTATVAYELATADSGEVGAGIWDGFEQHLSSLTMPMLVTKGSGTVTLSMKLVVPSPADKFWTPLTLAIWLRPSGVGTHVSYPFE